MIAPILHAPSHRIIFRTLCIPFLLAIPERMLRTHPTNRLCSFVIITGAAYHPQCCPLTSEVGSAVSALMG